MCHGGLVLLICELLLIHWRRDGIAKFIDLSVLLVCELTVLLVHKLTILLHAIFGHVLLLLAEIALLVEIALLKVILGIEVLLLGEVAVSIDATSVCVGIRLHHALSSHTVVVRLLHAVGICT